MCSNSKLGPALHAVLVGATSHLGLERSESYSETMRPIGSVGYTIRFTATKKVPQPNFCPCLVDYEVWQRRSPLKKTLWTYESLICKLLRCLFAYARRSQKRRSSVEEEFNVSLTVGI